MEPRAVLLWQAKLELAAFEELIAAIAANPIWRALGPATLVARTHPSYALVALGRFDAPGLARLTALRQQLELLPWRRYLDYRDIERACAGLADKLRAELGPALPRARFVGIPRGGLIVLGMLSYLLELDHAQLAPGAAGAPLVIIDDCAITGARFQSFVRELPAEEVIFAQLYSHPALRAAIVAREARVRACIAACDLHDLAPARLGAAYPAWQARWLARQQGRGYWVGQPEPLGFPWGEPEAGFWNPLDAREEAGWSLLAPARCLKYRRRHAELPVQWIPAAPALPAHLLHADFEGATVLIDLRNQHCMALEGAAAEMWRALVAGIAPAAAASALAARYEAPLSQLEQDLCTFREALQAAGYLT